MKKNAKMGILFLLLWASLLALLAFVFFGGPSGLSIPRFLSYAVPVFACGFYILVFLAVKESRIRLLAFLSAGIALGFFLDWLNLSRGVLAAVLAGIFILYLLACSSLNFRRLQKALQPMNEAALAYQKDHDGEKCLAALDRCAEVDPKVGIFKRPDTGPVTYQEHILCEKIQVLGDMGRLEERQALIEQLRSETEKPGLLKWLEEKAGEFSISDEAE